MRYKNRLLTYLQPSWIKQGAPAGLKNGRATGGERSELEEDDT